MGAGAARWRPVLGTTLLWAASAGCPEMSGSSNTVSAGTSRFDGRVELEATLEIENDTAVLEYSVENRGDRAVFLFNRLHDRIDPDGLFHTDPDLVYVERRGPALVISKKVPPVPEDLEVESRIVPCAVRLGPGERFTEAVRLPLPLGLRFAYPLPSEAPPESPAEAWFELGYVAIAPEREDLIMRVQTAQGEAWYFSSFRAEKQAIVRVGPLSHRVPVTGG